MSTTYLINLVFTLSYIKSGYVHKEIQLTLKYKHIWSEALRSSHRHTLNRPVMWTGVGVHGGLDTQVKAIPYHPNNDQQPGDCYGGAGDIVLWHHRLAHTGPPNTTRRIRRAVLYEFTKKDIEQTQLEPPQKDMWRDWSPEFDQV